MSEKNFQTVFDHPNYQYTFYGKPAKIHKK